MASSPDEALLARYLIGLCSDDERERVERDFFARDETFDRLDEIEEDLVGRYQRNELSGEERAAFERAFSTDARRERALFRMALTRHSEPAGPIASARVQAAPVSVPSSGESTWRRWIRLEPLGARLALAGITLAVSIAAAVLAVRNAEQRSAIDSAAHAADTLRQQLAASGEQTAEWQNRAAALADQLRRNQPAPANAPAQPPAARLLATFVLSPGLTRGSRTPTRILLPQPLEAVRLQLLLETDPGFAQYRAEVRTAAGDLVWSEDGLPRGGSATAPEVSVTVPAALLIPGEHELILRGRTGAGPADEIASYFFTVTRR